MRKILWLPLAAMLLLSACGHKVVVDETRTLERNVWNRFTPEVFEIDVNNADNYYNIDFAVAIDTARFRYQNMPFVVDMYSADGEHRMFYSDMPLKLDGRWKGEMNGNYREFQQRIRACFSFNKAGKYRLEVKQGTSQYDLEGIHSFRLRVERTKPDYEHL